MTPRLLTILTFIIGLGLFSYSLTLPYYKDQKAAEKLIRSSYDFDKNEYYKIEAELRTSKKSFMDLGAGIAVASSVIFLFLSIFKVQTFYDLLNLTSLKDDKLFLRANQVWLLMIPGTIWYYAFRSIRADYPAFADNIAIPILGSISFFAFLFIPLNIFLVITTYKSNLPARLLIKADKYTRPVVLWELFFGIFLIVNLICFFGFVLCGDHISIFVNLFFTLLLLTLRAGQISRYNNKYQNASL